MNRNYANGKFSDKRLFSGVEVENTPAKNMTTLFVVGVMPVEEIESHMNA